MTNQDIHYAFEALMGYYYSVYHCVGHSPKAAPCILLIPVAAHGVYDALAMNGLVDSYISPLEKVPKGQNSTGGGLDPRLQIRQLYPSPVRATEQKGLSQVDPYIGGLSFFVLVRFCKTTGDSQPRLCFAPEGQGS